jgi:short-chain fatty acids transporter
MSSNNLGVQPPAGAGTLPRLSAFAHVTYAFDNVMRRWLPDPLVLAIAFTVIMFVLGLALTDSTPIQMVAYWGDGFWRLLELAMQFVLVLCTGFILAISPVFKKVLGSLARLSTTPGSAIINVTLVALGASWINWAFGLVIGALYAKEMVRHVPTVNFRLLIASAYSGFLIWHGGLGGSIPLLINTPGHFAEPTMGLIPTSQTIFSAYNIVIVIALVIIIPLVNRLMMGAHGNEQEELPPSVTDAVEEPPAKTDLTPAERIENSMVISMVIGALGLAYLVYYFATKGFNLNINIVNFVFLTLAILFSGTPRRFLDGLQVAVKGVGGIVVQFPFYAGIMGMMAGSGLVAIISGWFVAISSETTLPLFTFLSAGFVNIFIPSGGGQWAVQGPVMIQAAQELGVDLPRIAMAVAWGDAWTNMIQPFWALPALAIAGLKARDIMGYLLMVLLVSGIVIPIGLLFV